MEMLTKNFSRDEMACPCGDCDVQMNPEFMRKLQKVRDIVGFPMFVSEGGGARCVVYNKSLKKASKVSQHLLGHAADVGILLSSHRYQIISAALLVGMRGIGVYETFIHLDDRPDGVPVVWVG